MMGAKLGSYSFYFLKLLVLTVLCGYPNLGHRLSWLTGWRERERERERISIRENDFFFLVTRF